MNTLTRRGMRLALMTVGFAGLFVAVNAVPGAATGQVPPGSFHPEELARGTLSTGSLQVKSGLVQIVVTKNKIDFPGSSGWHSHPGGAIIVVMQGQITTYRAVESDQEDGRGHTGNSRCVKNVYKVGDSFIERPGEPLNAVNTSPDGNQAIVYATFPGVPIGGSPRTDQPKPDACRV